MRRNNNPAAFKFVAVVSLTLTAVTLGAVLMQSLQHERAANRELRRSAEQLVEVIVHTLFVSPELFKPETLLDIIGRLSMAVDDIDRISVSDAKGVIVADFDQHSVGVETDYPTVWRAYESGQIEADVSTEGGLLSASGAGTSIILSARLLAPFNRERGTNLLGVVTVEASRRVSIGAIDFRLIGVIALILAAGFLFTASLFRALRNLLDEASNDLMLARDRAEAANVAKSEFLANMSHEIRTPINGVLGMADLLNRSRLADNQRQFVETILTSGHALLDVINHVLDFSKIDARQLELHPEPFRLSDIADEPARLLAQMAAEKGLELLVRVAPDLPSHALGDFPRLRQVVINLVANAIKFTETGQVVIAVSGVQAEDGGVGIRVEVADTGVGIPEDQLLEVFDKFRQIDNSSTRQHEGTGLGLSISKGLVELMGGEIGVTSTLGEGSVFWFEAALPTAPSDPPRALPARLRTRRVLVIDDNGTSRDILGDLLVAWRLPHATAASGREGLETLEAAEREGEAFDLVILDLEMPGMDGGMVLGRIRATPSLKRVPVILLSTIAGAEADRRDASALPIAKPTQAARLLDAIIAALDPTSPEAAMLGAEAAPEDVWPSLALRQGAAAGRVLVAEDNEVNAFVAEQVMLNLGLGFARARNGVEAVERFRSGTHVAVLMDVSMPVMNGFEATRRIRAIEAEFGLDPIPIIGLTAHALTGDQEKCIDAGMSDYIAKPFSVEALGQMLSKWLRPEAEDEKADPAAAA